MPKVSALFLCLCCFVVVRCCFCAVAVSVCLFSFSPFSLSACAGNLYACDSGRHCIFVFDRDGKIVTVIRDSPDVCEWQLQHVMDCAIGKDGRVYAMDLVSGLVHVYSFVSA